MFVHPTMNNGILHGPWIPVYGLGVVIIALITKFVNQELVTTKWKKMVITFFAGSLLLTLIEFLGGHLIQAIFNEVFWSYYDMKYHFGHYICLEMSIIWGLVSVLFLYIIKPWLNVIVKKIPIWITIPIFILFIVDVIITFL